MRTIFRVAVSGVLVMAIMGCGTIKNGPYLTEEKRGKEPGPSKKIKGEPYAYRISVVFVVHHSGRYIRRQFHAALPSRKGQAGTRLSHGAGLWRRGLSGTLPDHDATERIAFVLPCIPQMRLLIGEAHRLGG